MLFVGPSMKNENKDEQSEDYKPDCWLCTKSLCP